MATTTKVSTLAVQMPADIAKRSQRLAEENGRTVQQEIRQALRDHVERDSERSAG